MRMAVRRLHKVSCAVCLGMFGLYVYAQTAPTASARFESASIRPSRPDAQNSELNFQPGRITTENMSLVFLIKVAYGLNKASDDQLAGLPVWARDAKFDVHGKEDEATAKAMSGAPFEEEERIVGGLLRNLLEDRFGLKVHTEEQTRTVDALVLTKSGSKLEAYVACTPSVAGEDCEHGFLGLHQDGHGHIQGRDARIAMLADWLPSQPDIGGRIVVDKTGLEGNYTFDLHYTPQDAAAGENTGPSLFSALQEQLGLKLETRKLPIKVLVIDHIEPPSPN